MKKFSIAMLVMMVLSMATMAVAQEAAPAAAEGAAAAAAKAPATLGDGLKFMLIPFGAGLVVIGGGFGIARIGAGAVDAMARQPEYAGAIQTGMILAAALVEGATLFALVSCLLGYIL